MIDKTSLKNTITFPAYQHAENATVDYPIGELQTGYGKITGPQPALDYIKALIEDDIALGLKQSLQLLLV